MADFKPRTWVVIRDMPSLLGVGRVTETPTYSAVRLTWVEFGYGVNKTTSAFEPGELMTLSEWITDHDHHLPQVGRIYNRAVMPEIDMPCTHIDGIPAQRSERLAVSIERLHEMINQERFTETARVGAERHE